MFISNLFPLESEIWTVSLHPSQPTSACISHSLVQVPVHKIPFPSSLSWRKGWSLPGGQLNICTSVFREGWAGFHFQDWKEALSPPLCCLLSALWSPSQVLALLLRCFQAACTKWPSIPSALPQRCSPFLIASPLNSPGGCFPSESTTASPELFPQKETLRKEAHLSFRMKLGVCS